MKKTFERYHIEVVEALPKAKLPPKFIIRRYNNCVNVQECTQACIYGVHVTTEDGRIAEPVSDLCRGCHLCVLTCPKGALSIEINPEFEKLGNSYFTPDRIRTIHFESETGRVPVSGTGYKGPFAGQGFDSIWFDFSEIVRPTRDGIHGREYISTAVDLGRRLPYLEFDKNGKLLSDIPKIIEIPIPVIFDTPAASNKEKNLQLAVVKAAYKLGTFAIVNSEVYCDDFIPYKSNIIPRISFNDIDKYEHLIEMSRIVEFDYKKGKIKKYLKRIKEKNPSALVSFRFPYDEKSKEIAEFLTKVGADIVHFYANDEIIEQVPDYIKDSIRSIHLHLVKSNVRDEITFISSGGIAEAAHIPKSIILGADAVTVGLAYQIAMGYRVCNGGHRSENVPMKIDDRDVEWATQRIINFMGSWRDQLLEVLGGMGLRELRRQRGETGRAMFYGDLESKIFGDGK